jgi:hypothetical protein
VKVNRDYLIAAAIGGVAVSLLNKPRLSSLKEDFKTQQASYDEARANLELQISQAENKDDIIEIQRQQILLERKQSADVLARTNNMWNEMHSGMYKIAYHWRAYAMHLATQLKNKGIRRLGSKEYYTDVHMRIEPSMAHEEYLTYQSLPHIENYNPSIDLN